MRAGGERAALGGARRVAGAATRAAAWSWRFRSDARRGRSACRCGGAARGPGSDGGPAGPSARKPIASARRLQPGRAAALAGRSSEAALDRAGAVARLLSRRDHVSRARGALRAARAHAGRLDRARLVADFLGSLDARGGGARGPAAARPGGARRDGRQRPHALARARCASPATAATGSVWAGAVDFGEAVERRLRAVPAHGERERRALSIADVEAALRDLAAPRGRGSRAGKEERLARALRARCRRSRRSTSRRT